ncbi:MAG: hypothetical protein J0H66_12725 [Solirubrobacterales bacterium]|nr:hypothetical protein [Solirubrobacterales bacterium]OJU93360.1 MAG: hypothetical protein BGO23_11840 [Solirubrobacterales bacterium 67-14]
MARIDENDGALPYVDEHTIQIEAPPEQAWDALQRHAATLGFPENNPLAKVLGTDPPRGFATAEVLPGRRLTLAGHHRFARYELAFELTRTSDGKAELHARTYAKFPGFHGRVYRALVIGTGAHALATNHILRSIRNRAAGGSTASRPPDTPIS